MKKLRSMLISLTIVLAVCLAMDPIQVRADPTGPQNTSNSQSTGSSSPTVSEIIITILKGIHF